MNLLDPSVFDHSPERVAEQKPPQQQPQGVDTGVQSDFATFGTPLQEVSSKGEPPLAVGRVSIRKVLARGVPATGDKLQGIIENYPGVVVGQHIPGVLQGSVVASIRLAYIVETKQGSMFIIEPLEIEPLE